MFGLFKKKVTPPSGPFANDGNPIHQAILGIKGGDSNQVKTLLAALGDHPVIVPMAEVGNLSTAASQMFNGAPYLSVYTRPEFMTNENAAEYPHREAILLPKVCWALGDKVEIGLLINAGHPEVGTPLPPNIFRLFRDAVEPLRPPLYCVPTYPTPGEDGSPWAPSLPESDPLYAQMAKLATGDESLLDAVLSALANCFVTLPLKEKGRLDSALVLRTKVGTALVAVTRPEFLDQMPAAKDYPYRAQMTVRTLCSHLGTKNITLALNTRHASSVPLLPRFIERLMAISGKAVHAPAPAAVEQNEIEKAVVAAKQGDKSAVFRLFDGFVLNPVFLTLTDKDRLDSCGMLVIEKEPCMAVFTRREYIRQDHLADHPYVVQNLVHQVLALAKGKPLGVVINQGHPQMGMAIPPAGIKVFLDAVKKGTPVPVVGGLYYVVNDRGTFSPLKILKTDEQGVHIRQYSNQYGDPPKLVDEATLYMAGTDREPGEVLGAGHMPISKKAFAISNAVFFQQSTVSEEELEGFKVWQEAKGGYF